MAIQIIYYPLVGGDEPVRQFLDGLNFKVRQKFFARQQYLLQLYGENIPSPHVRSLGDQIYELKVSLGSLEYRFLFFRYKNLIVFVSAFRKQSQKTPKHEIDLARERRSSFLQRCKNGELYYET